jgi:hypothetical protein
MVLIADRRGMQRQKRSLKKRANCPYSKVKQKAVTPASANDEFDEDTQESYCASAQLGAYDRVSLADSATVEVVKSRKEPIETIQVGNTEYKLRKPSSTDAMPVADGTWEFRVDAIGQRFVGRGTTISEARNDFRLLIHSTFQSLVRIRPFRMTEEQIADWKALDIAIDVEEYWRTVPIALREVGFVSSSRRGNWQVTWLDGRLIEEVNANQVPDEFFSYVENQWFEAIVERDPGSRKLRRLIYVQQVDPVRQLTEDERKTWFDSLPGSDSLPKSDLTWKTL